MLRKQIIRAASSTPVAISDEIDIPVVATVLVTSEDADHPIDHAFDDRRAPGGADEEEAEQKAILVVEDDDFDEEAWEVMDCDGPHEILDPPSALAIQALPQS
jgi:hypothetical protein